MIYPAWQQFLILSMAMAGGFAIAAFFDAAEAIRLLLHLKKRKMADLLLWLLAAGLFFWLWLILFKGAFRLLYFVWLAIGYAIYSFALSRPLSRFAAKRAGKTSPIIKAVKFFSKGDSFLISKAIELGRLSLRCLRAAKVFIKRFFASLPLPHKKDEND